MFALAFTLYICDLPHPSLLWLIKYRKMPMLSSALQLSAGSQYSATRQKRLAQRLRNPRSAVWAVFRQFPVDIFLEVSVILYTIRFRMKLSYISTQIFSHMHPRDLLSFSRTSKWLRSVLMSHRHRFVWVSALEQVEGLPSCLPGMSKPAYSALLFTKNCSVSDQTFDLLHVTHIPCKPVMRGR